MAKIIPFRGEGRGRNYDQSVKEFSLLTDEDREQLLVPALKALLLDKINALPESELEKKFKLINDFNLLIHVGGLMQFGETNNLLPEDFSEQRLLVQEYAKSKNIKKSE